MLTSVRALGLWGVAMGPVNALISYCYLYDMPGADQVNIDGERGGPRIWAGSRAGYHTGNKLRKGIGYSWGRVIFAPHVRRAVPFGVTGASRLR